MACSIKAVHCNARCSKFVEDFLIAAYMLAVAMGPNQVGYNRFVSRYVLDLICLQDAQWLKLKATSDANTVHKDL